MAEDSVIAVAAANFAHTFPSQVLTYITKCVKPGQNITRLQTYGMADGNDKLLKALDKIKPTALIGVSIDVPAAIVAEYRAKKVPVILIDAECEGASTVTTDNMAGGYIAGAYLAKQERKNIAIVSGRMNVEGGFNAKKRFAGFMQALKESGVEFNPKFLAEVISYSYSEGAEAMQKFIKDGIQPDAVFCAAGDMCAMGILKAIRELKMAIPETIALVGYDDIDAAKTCKPALTTIRQPIEEMAVNAYMMAVDEAEELIITPKKKIFKPELVKRESA
jgi:LacI family transcriptional regulator